MTNPDLQALRSKECVGSAQIFDAGLLSDPKLDVAFEKVLHQISPPTIWFKLGFNRCDHQTSQIECCNSLISTNSL